MVSTTTIIVITILAIWEGAWKIPALWKSARRNQHNWFISIFILNTLGILPIVYLVWFQAKKKFSHFLNSE